MAAEVQVCARLMAEGWLKVQGIWLLLDLAWLVMKAEG